MSIFYLYIHKIIIIIIMAMYLKIIILIFFRQNHKFLKFFLVYLMLQNKINNVVNQFKFNIII